MALTFDTFVTRSRAIHGDKYDYSKFVYVNWDTKSTIYCPLHGPFLQKPRQHIERKSGCKLCGNMSQSDKKRVTFSEFVDRAQMVHETKYSYDETSYTGFKSPITICCAKHGEFSFNHAYTHVINKSGCPSCAREQHRLTNAQFIQKSQEIHGDLYDYANVQYVTNAIPVQIVCRTHGVQSITPTDHYRVGCWFCKRNRMQDIWLDELKIPNTKQTRQKRITLGDKLHIVDGYNTTTNTVYLFHGDYWHGNPELYSPDDINKRNGKTFGSLYQDTLNYESRLRNAGYTVISIWEHSWLQAKRVDCVNES